MKLIKAAVNRWLSHGKKAQRVLDCCKILMAPLYVIYMRRMEPAVHSVTNDLFSPIIIATLCFLAQILHSPDILQCVLQGSRVNFLQLEYKFAN